MTDWILYVHPDRRPGDDATCIGIVRNTRGAKISIDDTLEVRESTRVPHDMLLVDKARIRAKSNGGDLGSTWGPR